jgi:hypothetical protein
MFFHWSEACPTIFILKYSGQAGKRPTILSKETIKRSVLTEIALAIQLLPVRNGKLQQFIRLVKGKYSCF